jgi:methyl-accepting chemotaxis protein
VSADVTSNLEELPQRVAAIEQRLESLEQSVNRQFDQVNQRFAQVNQQFDQVNQQFAQVNQRFEEVNQRFEEVSQAFVEQREYTEFAFGRLERRIVSIEQRMPTRNQVERLRIASLDQFTLLHQKLDLLIASRRPRRRTGKKR